VRAGIEKLITRMIAIIFAVVAVLAVWDLVPILTVLLLSVVIAVSDKPPVDAAPWSAGGQFNRKIAYDTLVYEGQTYRTVKIGNLTWTAENLNFETGNSVCYAAADSNCTKYGRLYDWETALRACPAGWRLPGSDDWDNLVLAAGGRIDYDCEWDYGGTRLQSKTGWKKHYSGIRNATDDFGFSAVPGGFRDFLNYWEIGERAFWWSATKPDYDTGSVWALAISDGSQCVSRYDLRVHLTMLSLRCVKE